MYGRTRAVYSRIVFVYLVWKKRRCNSFESCISSRAATQRYNTCAKPKQHRDECTWEESSLANGSLKGKTCQNTFLLFRSSTSSVCSHTYGYPYGTSSELYRPFNKNRRRRPWMKNGGSVPAVASFSLEFLVWFPFTPKYIHVHVRRCKCNFASLDTVIKLIQLINRWKNSSIPIKIKTDSDRN